MKGGGIVNIGVLGVASIAKRSVIPAINSLPRQFKLAGIASRDLSKAELVAAPLGCKAYGSYKSLLVEPSIDAVYIPLPNALHFASVITALENGKHVLVEKSLGSTLDEVEKIVEVARARNRVIMENFQFRFHSQLSTILQLVKTGAIGDLRSMRVSFGFPPFADPDNIRYRADLGGGALLDAGAYPMKLAPFFLGDDIGVAHATMAHDRQKGVDVWGAGTLQQRNAPLCCHFAYGFDHYYQCSLELWGKSGKLSANRIFTAPPEFSPRLLIETRDGIDERILPADNHFEKMLAYFYTLITGPIPLEEEYTQTIRQAKLIQDFKARAIIHAG